MDTTDFYDLPESYKNPLLTEDRISDVFKEIDQSFERGEFSFVGDVRDFKLVYLTQASVIHSLIPGNLMRPVGSFICGETSTGKTELMYAASELIPSKNKINLTTISSKALLYACRYDRTYLNAKVILVEEMKGLDDQELQYLLRILVTKGHATHFTVHGGESETIEIVGGISLQSTGLPSDKLREDTMNRMVRLSTDPSAAMTEKVISEIKGLYSRAGATKNSGLEHYQEFFSELCQSPKKVLIPYADDIQFEAKNPESRRMAKIFLDLLATVALLNQKRRDQEDGYVISTPEDFHILYEVISREREQTRYKLIKSEKAILEAVQVFRGREFDYRDIEALEPGRGARRTTGYGMTTIKDAVKTFVRHNLVEKKEAHGSVVLSLKDSQERVNDWGVAGLSSTPNL